MGESSKNNNSQNVKKNEVTLTFGMSRDFIDQVRENINNLDEEYLKKNVLTHIFSAEIHAKNDNNEKALKELIIAKEIATKNKDLNTLNDIKYLIQSLNQIEK